jgi:hypothetical protein
MMVDADLALLSTPGAARGEPIRGESW